jgi:outer membrane beta-barrel protein
MLKFIRMNSYGGVSMRILLFMTFILASLQTHASETSTYDFKWLDPDKEVYVLQNRKFRKVDRFYMSLAGGMTTSGAFSDATVLQGRAGYFFKEDWGIEFIYSSNSPDYNDTYESVLSKATVPFVRQIQNYYGGMLVWSPFYNKINTFDKILYFDWVVGLGAAKVEEENNRPVFNSSSTTDTGERQSESFTGVIWGTGLRFYGSESFSVRLDLTALNYQGTKALPGATEKAWYDNYDLTIGVAYAF